MGAAAGSIGSRAACPATGGRLCQLPVPRAAAARRAGKPAARLRRHRRGSRHRAGRLPRDDAGGQRAVLPDFHVRAARRRQLCAARRISAARRRLGRDPRPRDPEGVLARPRHRLAAAARALPRRGCRGDRGGRAPPRPPPAARGAWRARDCSRPSGSPNSCRRTASRSMASELGDAILAYLARSRARLMLVQIEDVVGEAEQANLPGTTDAHPNWRRRLLARAGRHCSPGRRLARVAALIEEARRRSAIGMSRAPSDNPPRSAPPIGCSSTDGFTFRDAAALVPYLARLGISHVYASPMMEARPGSTHGYDIVDHNRLNPEIGSEADFAALIGGAAWRTAWASSSISCPTTWGSASDNAWWLDVLEWGEASPYAAYFDINWDAIRDGSEGPGPAAGAGRPIWRGPRKRRDRAALRSRAKAASARGITTTAFRSRRSRYPTILRRRRRAAWPSLARRFRGAAPAAGRRRARARRAELKRRLADTARRSRDARERIDAALQAVRRPAGRPESFGRLHQLLEAQAYRIAYLARRRRGDQLPPLFQHQRSRRAADRIAGAVRARPTG